MALQITLITRNYHDSNQIDAIKNKLMEQFETEKTIIITGMDFDDFIITDLETKKVSRRWQDQ